MANTRQQRKRVRITQREHEENLRYKSRIKTMFRSLTVAAAEDKERAATMGLELTSLIDKAASRGVLHPKNAAKKKARVASMVEMAEGTGLPRGEARQEPVQDKSKAERRNDRRGARKTKKAEARASIRARAQAEAEEAAAQAEADEEAKVEAAEPETAEEPAAKEPETAEEPAAEEPEAAEEPAAAGEPQPQEDND